MEGNRKSPALALRTISELANVEDYKKVSFRGLVGFVREMESKNQKKYLQVQLRDSTSDIVCQVWEDSNAYEFIKIKCIPGETIIAVLGPKSTYNGKTAMTIDTLKTLPDERLVNYIKSTSMSIDDMFNYIKEQVGSIREPYRTIGLRCMTDNEKKFKEVPAAKINHDNFLGGLLEHTYKMMKFHSVVKEVFSAIDEDIFIFEVLEHDFKKIDGYRVLPSVDLTEEEKFIGHIIDGAIDVRNYLEPYKEIDDITKMAIINAILSHHETEENGSPVKPITIEAIALHYVDDMCAKLAYAEQTIIDNNYKDGEIISGRDKCLYYVKYKPEAQKDDKDSSENKE